MRIVGGILMVAAVIFMAFSLGAIPLGYWLTVAVDGFLAAVLGTVGLFLYRKAASR